ncbi:MAG: M23 family metallopeptidase [bacterium]|nr:M23 family metallopeptidase [bacterium]
MLLLQKKHSAFLKLNQPILSADRLTNRRATGLEAKTAITSVFLGFLILFAFPVHAHAGFFCDVLGIFCNSKQITEERSPLFIKETRAATVAMPVLDSTPNPDVNLKSAENTNSIVVQSSAIVAPQNPNNIMRDDSFINDGQIFIHTVELGDTPSSIAKAHGITVNTLLWANDISDVRKIQVGDKLVVRSIDGVEVKVEKGDTINSIAQKYKGNIEDILSLNSLSIDERLVPGTLLFISDGELPWTPSTQPSAPTQNSKLPTYFGYYIRPIQGGVRTQGLHGKDNAVDLATSCAEPIYAAVEGTVIIAKGSGRNGGYGKYVVIAHSNTQTVYAHLSQVFVSVSQYVSQGFIIGTVGSTGNSSGCHVHFGVLGARNPGADNSWASR